MNQVATHPGPVIRSIPLSQLELAPENVCKTRADPAAQAELKASIEAHGLLENLVARAEGPGPDGAGRYAVIAGGRRLAALQALHVDGVLGEDHPVPCLMAGNAAMSGERRACPGLSAAPLGRSDMDPAGGSVDGSGVAERLDESLDEHGRCVVALGPVLGQAPADDGEDVRAQVGDIDPGQDQEPRVIEHEGQVLLA